MWAESDAVMVGSGASRCAIVVDSNVRTPATARVLDDAAPTLIAVAETPTARTCRAGSRSSGCRALKLALTSAS
ncbi:MAG: hypothetical protein ACRDYX_22565 [Egibacteraceae bacterium]